jgi:hypothetical protein
MHVKQRKTTAIAVQTAIARFLYRNYRYRVRTKKWMAHKRRKGYLPKHVTLYFSISAEPDRPKLL